jgi:hypothetical protein
MLARIPLIIGFVCFFAINLYLWSLPISQQTLFAMAAPLGIVYFIAFFWYVVRTPSNRD